MQGWGKLGLRLGLAAAVAWAAGCVPLTDYHALERRFKEQESYVERHKDDVREHERQKKVLTIRAREKENQLELTRSRLKKSETLRSRLAGQLRAMREAGASTVAASTPKMIPAEKVLGLEVNPATNGLVLESGLLFPSGKAVLTSNGKRVLGRVARELNGPKYRGRSVQVVGHTDDQPIRRSRHKSNWDLAAKRSLAVLHFLEKSGINADRLSFAGFGPHKPIQPGKSRRARSRNRRVEIVLFE